MPQAMLTAKEPKVRQCIDNCTACSNICVETATYCLNMGGKHADPAHIALLFNCYDICRVSADYMLGSSEFISQICSLCAQVNDRCASSCDQFGDDEQMKACADMCRTCADSCRQMAEL